ncbi:hypothetical protein [Photorhabdus australis]|uniref:hypothetical protein n=1 Tax=Photorhabdus australis TaxID=286156 RepID=UPI0008167726
MLDSYLTFKGAVHYAGEKWLKIKSRIPNKVTEFTVGGDINLMAKDEVTLEASRLGTNKNAK